MFPLHIKEIEMWDSRKEEFIYIKPQTILLEHSLVSISKWEMRYGRSFLSKGPSTRNEKIDYVRCMTITQNVSPDVYNGITDAQIKQIYDYMDHPMSATKIYNSNSKTSADRSKTVTSEQIYSWMIEFGVPFECQKWHLNRLLTLIRVCEINSRPPKKQSKNDIYRQNASLNEQRKRLMRSRG